MGGAALLALLVATVPYPSPPQCLGDRRTPLHPAATQPPRLRTSSNQTSLAACSSSPRASPQRPRSRTAASCLSPCAASVLPCTEAPTPHSLRAHTRRPSHAIRSPVPLHGPLRCPPSNAARTHHGCLDSSFMMSLSGGIHRCTGAQRHGGHTMCVTRPSRRPKCTWRPTKNAARGDQRRTSHFARGRLMPSICATAPACSAATLQRLRQLVPQPLQVQLPGTFARLAWGRMRGHRGCHDCRGAYAVRRAVSLRCRRPCKACVHPHSRLATPFQAHGAVCGARVGAAVAVIALHPAAALQQRASACGLRADGTQLHCTPLRNGWAVCSCDAATLCKHYPCYARQGTLCPCVLPARAKEHAASTSTPSAHLGHGDGLVGVAVPHHVVLQRNDALHQLRVRVVRRPAARGTGACCGLPTRARREAAAAPRVAGKRAPLVIKGMGGQRRQGRWAARALARCC